MAAAAVRQQIEVYNATKDGDIDRAFATIVQRRLGALLVTGDPFSFAQHERLVALAARHAVPTIYWAREFAEGGGLISYGASQKDAFHQAGIYAGRILKGEKSADLPIMLPTSSISRPPRRSASKSRLRCCCAPTRSLNEAPRFHHAARRRGGSVAARGAGAGTRPHVPSRPPINQHRLILCRRYFLRQHIDVNYLADDPADRLERVCPLLPESGQTGRRLGMSA